MASPDDAQPVDIDEVLPPEDDPKATKRSPKSAGDALKKTLLKAIARLLDECLTLPISKKGLRIGLDPILGFFFPAIGDAFTATLGSTILLEGLRRQLPRAVIMRMGMHIAVNAAVGTIPVLGDLFSIWYKSNVRNYALLERHSGNKDFPPVKPNLLPLFLFVLGVVALIGLVLTMVILLFHAVFPR